MEHNASDTNQDAGNRDSYPAHTRNVHESNRGRGAIPDGGLDLTDLEERVVELEERISAVEKSVAEIRHQFSEAKRTFEESSLGEPRPGGESR